MHWGRGRTALHGAQDVIVAALEGDVEELAELGQLGAGADEALGEVARVGGGKADALDAWQAGWERGGGGALQTKAGPGALQSILFPQEEGRRGTWCQGGSI